MHSLCTSARTHKQTSKATISKLLRPSSVAKIRGLAAAGVTRSRKRCKVSFYICVYSNIERLVSHTSSYQLSNRSGRINTELGTHLAGGHGSSRRGARGQGGGCHALGGRGRSSTDQSCYSSSASPRRAPRIGFHLLIRCFPHSIHPSLSLPLLSSPSLLSLSSPLISPSLRHSSHTYA